MDKIYGEPWWMYSFESEYWGTSVTSAVDRDGRALPDINPKMITQRFVKKFGRRPEDGDTIRINCWHEVEHRLYLAIGAECPCRWKQSFEYRDR